MPCVFSTEQFKASGGYPEGNVSIETRHGFIIEPGDIWFFKQMQKKYGRQHVTAFDSLVYHIQTGEMDS